MAHWFSRLLTDALHSPAATELTDGRIQIVTGPFGRGEGMPTSPVEWLSILPKSVPYQYNQNLEKVLTETGFVLAPCLQHCCPPLARIGNIASIMLWSMGMVKHWECTPMPARGWQRRF